MVRHTYFGGEAYTFDGKVYIFYGEVHILDDEISTFDGEVYTLFSNLHTSLSLHFYPFWCSLKNSVSIFNIVFYHHHVYHDSDFNSAFALLVVLLKHSCLYLTLY